jgi:cobalt-zinc-cadmium efflux system protein
MEPRRALFIALFLSVAILILELTGGVVFRSAALTADALHVITDVLAVLFSLVALSYSSRPPTDSLTYGYHRFEVIASVANGLSLLGVAGIILYEAYLRFLTPQPIDVLGTVAVAATALAINAISSKIISTVQADPHGTKDLNISSAGAHIFGDALASLAVIVGATAVFFTGVLALDPLVAVFIGFLVIRSAVNITKQGGAIILERSPFKDMGELQQKLGSVSGVADVHDLHVWRICSHITVASMHACMDPNTKDTPAAVRIRLEREMGRLGMQHVTIQLEDTCCAPTHAHSA